VSEIHDKRDIDTQEQDRQIVFWLKRGGAEERGVSAALR
jgi:hypothetical protein